MAAVDLHPLLADLGGREPARAEEFFRGAGMSMWGLGYARDRCAVLVRDGPGGAGVSAEVCEGKGVRRRRGRDRLGAGGQKGRGREVVPSLHVYDLRRGRTAADVEAVECAGAR